MQTVNMQISSIFITSANNYWRVFSLPLYNFDDSDPTSYPRKFMLKENISVYDTKMKMYQWQLTVTQLNHQHWCWFSVPRTPSNWFLTQVQVHPMFTPHPSLPTHSSGLSSPKTSPLLCSVPCLNEREYRISPLFFLTIKSLQNLIQWDCTCYNECRLFTGADLRNAEKSARFRRVGAGCVGGVGFIHRPLFVKV